MMRTLDPNEEAIVAAVRQFVDKEVKPTAHDLEASNTYPEDLIASMAQLGVFGLAIPEPYGEVAVSMRCYAMVTEELSRGWMSLAGAMGSHSVVAKLISTFGTPEQKSKYLPLMATGELRAAMALTEPGGGSDLQALRTRARRTPDGYVLEGSKTWITNARKAGLIVVMCRTGTAADGPDHRQISLLLVEKGPGVQVARDLSKLGYRGVESCELVFDNALIPTEQLLGQEEGQGFIQMMRGLEIGRIQVAARALGVGRAAFEDSLKYSQQRDAFGKPIWRHQSIGNYLANMATKLSAARLLTLDAADRFDAGERCDLEAGMAKLFASEAGMEIALDAMRIHGGYGYSTEFDIERYFRDAPLMIVGEGTNEIQRNIITKQLVARHPIAK